MSSYDELLEKSILRLKNNYFTNIKSTLLDFERPEPILLSGASGSYIPNATAVKAGKNYILEVVTLETLQNPEMDSVLKGISKHAESISSEFIVALPVASFMEIGKKLTQLKVDAIIWDIQ